MYTYISICTKSTFSAYLMLPCRYKDSNNSKILYVLESAMGTPVNAQMNKQSEFAQAIKQ